MRTKKKSKKVDENYRDPDVTYALTNSKSRTLADAMKEGKVEPISDEEIAGLLQKPDWICAGITSVVLRMLKRFEVESLAGKSKVS